jgi:hypothetical protein
LAKLLSILLAVNKANTEWNRAKYGSVHFYKENMNRRNKQFSFGDKSISPHEFTRNRPVLGTLTAPTLALVFPIYTVSSYFFKDSFTFYPFIYT